MKGFVLNKDNQVVGVWDQSSGLRVEAHASLKPRIDKLQKQGFTFIDHNGEPVHKTLGSFSFVDLGEALSPDYKVVGEDESFTQAFSIDAFNPFEERFKVDKGFIVYIKGKITKVVGTWQKYQGGVRIRSNKKEVRDFFKEKLTGTYSYRAGEDIVEVILNEASWPEISAAVNPPYSLVPYYFVELKI